MERSPAAVGSQIYRRVREIRRVGGDDRHCSARAHARIRTPNVSNTGKVTECGSMVGPGMLKLSEKKSSLSAISMRSSKGNKKNIFTVDAPRWSDTLE